MAFVWFPTDGVKIRPPSWFYGLVVGLFIFGMVFGLVLHEFEACLNDPKLTNENMTCGCPNNATCNVGMPVTSLMPMLFALSVVLLTMWLLLMRK